MARNGLVRGKKGITRTIRLINTRFYALQNIFSMQNSNFMRYCNFLHAGNWAEKRTEKKKTRPDSEDFEPYLGKFSV